MAATKKKTKAIATKAKKKTAVARAIIKEGKGMIKINKVPLENYEPEYAKKIIKEPLILAQDVLGQNFQDNISIAINVKGGGVMGQAHACRTAIGKALTKWTESEELKKIFTDYDRSILINDVRVKESKKCLRKGARAKGIKSYR